jgi:hypothetical protein
MGLLPRLYLGAMRFVNSDDHSRSIIPLPDASLALARPEGGRVLSELLSDTLALARGEPLRKIGEHEWCEPDYRQILLWAEALELEPEEVIGRLTGTAPLDDSWEPTSFRNGRIVKLNWDLDLLPLGAFEWVDGLEIEYLRFDQSVCPQLTIERLALPLPKLISLHCEDVGLRELNLLGSPLLEELVCAGNPSVSFNLEETPKLTKLDCRDCCLTELDLRPVPLLRSLHCERNELTKLDVSFSRLLFLYCGCNQITELTRMPLFRLSCERNLLTELNLPRSVMMKGLRCSFNQLTKLDLSKVNNLTDLYCDNNLITEIDLSGIPRLERLDCEGNPIDLLDIRTLHNLEELDYDAETTRLVQREDQHFK